MLYHLLIQYRLFDKLSRKDKKWCFQVVTMLRRYELQGQGEEGIANMLEEVLCLASQLDGVQMRIIGDPKRRLEGRIGTAERGRLSYWDVLRLACFSSSNEPHMYLMPPYIVVECFDYGKSEKSQDGKNIPPEIEPTFYDQLFDSSNP